jgi:hypothetical protein
VTGIEKIGGKMKDGKEFALKALGTNIYEKRNGRWLMVHHHASKADDELFSCGRQGC